MRRREFITFVGGVATFPLAVRAQQTSAPTLGVLLVENREPFSRLFSEGLRDLGYINGQNIRIEFRSAQGNLSQLPELAADLVRHKVDIIVASETPAVLAAKRATSEIPIVMAPSGDPVGTGLIASLARPGGNVTGLSAATAELAGKSLELIREILPGVRRVAALADPTNAFTKSFLEQIHRAAAAANLEIEAIMVRGGEEFEAAFAQMTRRGIEAVIVQPTLPRAPIIELAKKSRVAQSRAIEHLPMRAASCRMPAASLIATEMQRHTWTRFLKVQSLSICRFNSLQNSNWSSISRPQKRSASQCRRHCSPAPMM
jgi:putative tryptophan/tyrosine transport system substrate-binding protein